MIESISAVALATHDTQRSPRFFTAPLLSLAMGCGVARAEDAVVHADLLCDGNAALALFAQGGSDDPPHYAVLPPKVDGGLSAQGGTDRTNCRLRDGTDVRIRAGSALFRFAGSNKRNRTSEKICAIALCHCPLE